MNACPFVGYGATWILRVNYRRCAETDQTGLKSTCHSDGAEGSRTVNVLPLPGPSLEALT